MALSTLKPATSPRLSAIQLEFSTTTLSIAIPIADAGNDLRRTADEVTRIEREFDGAVDVTVAQSSGFRQVFNTLNVRFNSCGVDDTP